MASRTVPPQAREGIQAARFPCFTVMALKGPLSFRSHFSSCPQSCLRWEKGKAVFCGWRSAHTSLWMPPFISPLCYLKQTYIGRESGWGRWWKGSEASWVAVIIVGTSVCYSQLEVSVYMEFKLAEFSDNWLEGTEYRAHFQSLYTWLIQKPAFVTSQRSSNGSLLISRASCSFLHLSHIVCCKGFCLSSWKHCEGCISLSLWRRACLSFPFLCACACADRHINLTSFLGPRNATIAALCGCKKG